MKHYDITIIGGGINGAGIAREAAGRDLNVLLCEQNDLASGTSSHSSKLIHGGLRYLEQFEFRLVREALAEREKLLAIAPHLIKALEFIMPYEEKMRPILLIRLGLFLYDHLSKRTRLPKSKKIDLTTHPAGSPLQDVFKTGFSYYDCFTNDARLVIANTKSAQELGATILTHTRCIAITAKSKTHWHLTLKNTLSGETSEISTKVLINATGPWLNDILHMAQLTSIATSPTLVKGSHIILSKLHEGSQAYILQAPNKRVVFVIPYEKDFTLVGTTDVEYQGSPSDARIEDKEIDYLCEVINCHFKHRISKTDILSTYSGVRALQNEEANRTLSHISRDYKIELIQENQPPFLNIVGGKLTTYRKLAEHALSLLTPIFNLKKASWTDNTHLPGGQFHTGNISSYLTYLQEKYTWLSQPILQRYLTLYGSDCETLLTNCETLSDMGQHFGHGLYEREVNYLVTHEWARTADDILWRRTKLGLYFSKKEKDALQFFIS